MSEVWQRAQAVMPGGVNSPVRSFNAVGLEPVFIQSAQGARVTDTEGKEYIDYVSCWGCMVLGHNDPRILEAVQKTIALGLSFGAPTTIEVNMAECMTSLVPGIDKVRMVNSGTEAVMSALRLARGFTGKSKIIKFAGCYHGHTDSMLVSAGSGALTLSVPDSAGVTPGQAQDTLLAGYNDLASVEALFANNPDEIAGVIVEPVAANMGVVYPAAGFLEGLRALCDKYNALLIFDEVITGFRLAVGGAQEFFGVRADIVTFGKIIGGGLPVGAYGAREEIMSYIAPLGAVYQAGTLSGNPAAMTAGLTQLSILRESPEIYCDIEMRASRLAEGLRGVAQELDVPVSVNQVGSLVCAFFTDREVACFADAKCSDTTLYAQYFSRMLSQGIHLAPAQFEAMFVGAAHTDEDIDKTIACAKQALNDMKSSGLF